MRDYDLPYELEVDGKYYEIDTDFRTALLIMQVYNDGALTEIEKRIEMLKLLYTPVPKEGEEPITNIPKNIIEAENKAMWFLNVGEENQEDQGKPRRKEPKVLDYEKDYNLLIAAVNEVVKRDIRETRTHWWSFHSYCQSINPKGYLSAVMDIRRKLGTGVTLTKEEQKFRMENKKVIDAVSELDNLLDMVINKK